jgi:hypothetical protein
MKYPTTLVVVVFGNFLPVELRHGRLFLSIQSNSLAQCV